jgi:hypothetical protein
LLFGSKCVSMPVRMTSGVMPSAQAAAMAASTFSRVCSPDPAAVAAESRAMASDGLPSPLGQHDLAVAHDHRAPPLLRDAHESAATGRPCEVDHLAVTVPPSRPARVVGVEHGRARQHQIDLGAQHVEDLFGLSM